MTSAPAPAAALSLADWRHRITDLYGEVRALAAGDPRVAWNRWREVRDGLYRNHPQSPVAEGARASHLGRYWPYDRALRFDVEVAVDAAPELGTDTAPGAAFIAPLLPMSSGDPLSFSRIGVVDVPFPAGPQSLTLLWMAGYAGGLFLPFRDATNGTATYGAGRYLLDTAKGADLGGDLAAGRLILDFNFAFQPSCAFDSRWSCPLAPPENRLDLRIEAGERIA